MIHIDFNEPNEADWREWVDACLAEQQLVIQDFGNGVRRGIINYLYKGKKWNIGKNYFFHRDSIFGGKCAYCETNIRPGQPGDIEHYRPKGGVREVDSNLPVKVTIDGIETDHPGYYWLPYEWRNMLPSCLSCNRPGSDSSTSIGKRNYFPVRDFRATEPGQEVNEEPILINPLVDEPLQHLKYLDSGELEALDDRGKATIIILGLNIRDLPIYRHQAYENTTNKLRAKWAELFTTPDNDRKRQLLSEYEQVIQRIKGNRPNNEPFVIAQRMAWQDFSASLKQQIDLILRNAN